MAAHQDEHYMRHALSLARRGLGRVWPNPAVGCVIVKNNIVIGRGWTADGGRPHAETQALKQAGTAAKGACAYVSLEPCAHEGKTSSCAQALIDAGVSRAVIACEDPDPRVQGKGAQMLRDAGIEAVTGVLAEEAEALNAGFVLRIGENRPYITLKTATSADGKIASAPGKRAWITGQLSRRRVHLERSMHDAILVGIGTVLADDPSLTTRLPDYDHKIVRVVLDTHLRIPPDSQLVKTAKGYPLWIFHEKGDGQKIEALQKAGVKLFQTDTNDIAALLKVLAAEGITRLLVEGGARIHTSFLQAGFCDRFLWFKAKHNIGDSGVDALQGYDISVVGKEFGLVRQKTQAFDEDSLEIYAKGA